jgi:hypothetical protein
MLTCFSGFGNKSSFLSRPSTVSENVVVVAVVVVAVLVFVPLGPELKPHQQPPPIIPVLIRNLSHLSLSDSELMLVHPRTGIGPAPGPGLVRRSRPKRTETSRGKEPSPSPVILKAGVGVFTERLSYNRDRNR